MEEIRGRISPVAAKRSVEKMYLFGSYAKGKATEASDVDLFVEAPKIHGIFALGGLYGDLEDALEKRIDLITAEALEYAMDRNLWRISSGSGYCCMRRRPRRWAASERRLQS